MLQSPTADQTEFNGRTATDRRSKQNGSHGHARAVPHIGQSSAGVHYRVNMTARSSSDVDVGGLIGALQDNF